MKKILILLVSCGLLAACGKSQPQPAAAIPVPAAPVAAAPAQNEALALGEAAFKKTCAMCHQSGVAGAPKLGSQADWGPRIAQGKDVLYKHALEGFTGEKGMMPAKGGNTAMTEDEVKAAVDFMVQKGS